MNDIAILFNEPLPETQVSAPYKTYSNSIMGNIQVTGGFMEPSGHGYKCISRKAINRNRKMIVRQPGKYNIGFDYSAGMGSNVICMYSGEVARAGKEGGYGYRIHILLDRKFNWQGKKYDVYQAYAHCSQLFYSAGDRVRQGDTIAIEAGHGKNGPNDYGSHVDLDTYCFIDGERVHLNFELLAESTNTLITGEFEIAANKKTVIKYSTQQSFLITTQNKFVFTPLSTPLLVNWLKDVGNHWQFELKTPINNRYNWYAFKADVEVSPVKSSIKSRWLYALKNCNTNGCSASHEIARRDWQKISPDILTRIKNAAKKYDIPPAIALALASRETHFGTILGLGDNKPGWGDHNNGFGIMQVDRRYHEVAGTHDPFSTEHIEQALGIFNQYRDRLLKIHPNWSDSNILKGTCVAYNSGVDNVRSISGMNIGTTHNDYGDDVIARAQYFEDKL